MIAKTDVYRTARVLMDQHGETTLPEAMDRLERYRLIGSRPDQAALPLTARIPAIRCRAVRW
jgi:hypothetical protein